MRRGGAVSLAVVGAHFPNADGSDRRFEMALCSPGEAVDLRPEPRNRHDPRAIAVYSCRGEQIGYLPAERAGWIGALISTGREWRAAYQARADFGAWIRVAFDGAEPVLPTNREAELAGDEWDQTPPEEQDQW